MENEIDKFFWFFSATAQSFAAIVAFIGALIVYRLQVISNYINDIFDSSYELRKEFFFRIYGNDSFTWGQTPNRFLVDFVKSIRKKPDEATPGCLMAVTFDKILRSHIFRQYIIPRFIIFLGINFFIIFYSLLLVFSVPMLGSSLWWYFFTDVILVSFSIGYTFYLSLIVVFGKKIGKIFSKGVEETDSTFKQFLKGYGIK